MNEIKQDKKDILSHLKIVVDVFKSNNVHFWMYGGALLGYIRDGNLISWNKDVDLFVWSGEYQKVLKLKREFKKHGFKVSVRENSTMLLWNDKNISIACYHHQGNYAIWVKLCTRNKFGNIVYYGVLCKVVEYNMNRIYRFLKWFLLKTNGCYLVKQIVPVHFYTELKEIDFFGIKLKVPKDTEQYFEYTFGKNWKTPIRKFQYTSKYIKVIEGKKPTNKKYHSNSIQ